MKWMLLAALVAGGCTTETGPCANPEGTFVQSYRRMGGSCPDLDPIVVNIAPGDRIFGSGDCVGDRVWAPDMCSLDIDLVCDSFDMSGRFVGTVGVQGITEWNTAADELVSTLFFCFELDTADDCCSTYEVTWRRP